MRDIEKILKNSTNNDFEIPLKVKHRIDYTLKNKNKHKWRIEFMKKRVIGAICATFVLVTGVVFANDIKVAIQSLFGGNASDGVDTAVNYGYLADVKTEVQNAAGINISVDSFIMDDYNFAMNFNVTLDEKYNIEEFEGLQLLDDLKIVDETGKTVFITHPYDKELAYKGSYSFLTKKIGENNLIFSLVATGNPEAFPKSKHLTVEFTKLSTKQSTYQGNWIFEVDVPEEFYTRETVIYKVKSCSEEGIDINSIQATLSNTALKISIPEIKTDKVDYDLLHTSPTKSIYDRIALQKEYVETTDGKRFETAQRSDGDGGYTLPAGENKIINYYQTFNLTKYDATDEITVHIFTNKGEEITIKLEK